MNDVRGSAHASFLTEKAPTHLAYRQSCDSFLQAVSISKDCSRQSFFRTGLNQTNSNSWLREDIWKASCYRFKR
jgi:hypothetical protein